jgi:hypothetical protein
VASLFFVRRAAEWALRPILEAKDKRELLEKLKLEEKIVR